VNRQQIEDRNYIAKLKVDDMRNIIKYGMPAIRRIVKLHAWNIRTKLLKDIKEKILI